MDLQCDCHPAGLLVQWDLFAGELGGWLSCCRVTPVLMLSSFLNDWEVLNISEQSWRVFHCSLFWIFLNFSTHLAGTSLEPLGKRCNSSYWIKPWPVIKSWWGGSQGCFLLLGWAECLETLFRVLSTLNKYWIEWVALYLNTHIK